MTETACQRLKLSFPAVERADPDTAEILPCGQSRAETYTWNLRRGSSPATPQVYQVRKLSLREEQELKSQPVYHILLGISKKLLERLLIISKIHVQSENLQNIEKRREEV